MSLLFFLGVVIACIWLLRRDRTPKQTPQYRDQMWLDYIASFRTVVKTKKEQHLIETLIEGKPADQLYATDVPAAT